MSTDSSQVSVTIIATPRTPEGDVLDRDGQELEAFKIAEVFQSLLRDHALGERFEIRSWKWGHGCVLVTISLTAVGTTIAAAQLIKDYTPIKAGLRDIAKDVGRVLKRRYEKGDASVNTRAAFYKTQVQATRAQTEAKPLVVDRSVENARDAFAKHVQSADENQRDQIRRMLELPCDPLIWNLCESTKDADIREALEFLQAHRSGVAAGTGVAENEGDAGD